VGWGNDALAVSRAKKRAAGKSSGPDKINDYPPNLCELASLRCPQSPPLSSQPPSCGEGIYPRWITQWLQCEIALHLTARCVRSAHRLNRIPPAGFVTMTGRELHITAGGDRQKSAQSGHPNMSIVSGSIHMASLGGPRKYQGIRSLFSVVTYENRMVARQSLYFYFSESHRASFSEHTTHK
jgi:hypothetical protein